MNDLIQITKRKINDSEVNSVNAKELHSALGLKIKFANWIKKQKEVLETYEEGVDYARTTLDANNFTVIVKKDLNLKGKECGYILSLDMAKHISLMSKTKKGKEVRQYFIEAEKKSNTMLELPNNAIKQIKLALAGVVELDERVDAHHDRLINLEQNARLSNQQEYELTQTHHKKVYKLAKQYGKDSEDKALIRKLHQRVWSVFKKHFMLPRFNELQVSKFDEGIAFINNLSLKDMT